jgi:hypothetical protein
LFLSNKIFSNTFTDAQLFHIPEIISVINEISPVIIVEPFTIAKRKKSNVMPVVEIEKKF